MPDVTKFGSRIYRGSKGPQRWDQMVSPYLRNAAGKLKRASALSDEPSERSSMEAEAADMLAFADYLDAKWAEENPEKAAELEAMKAAKGEVPF